MKLIIVSGLSGSGKTTAMKVLEDFGFYCVDNLPISFLPKFIDFCENENMVRSLALAVDIRAIGSLNEFAQIVSRLKKEKKEIHLIFIEASPEILINRYSESRRPHPFGGKLSLENAIKDEIKILSPIKAIADIKIDTSKTNIHEFKNLFKKYLDNSSSSAGKLNITLISFGFKYGLPLESDLVLDVRFLDNPYFHEELKALTGLDKPVIKFLSRLKESRTLLKKYFALLNFLLHQYSKEGRAKVTIAVGCTGGRHRSIYITEKIKEHLKKRYPILNVIHRDLQKSV